MMPLGKGCKERSDAKPEVKKGSTITAGKPKQLKKTPKAALVIAQPKVRRDDSSSPINVLKTNDSNNIDVHKNKNDDVSSQNTKDEVEIKGTEIDGNEEDYTEEQIDKIILEKLKNAKQTKKKQESSDVKKSGEKKSAYLPDKLETDTAERRKTEEGWLVYTPEELKLGLPGSGKTPLCPFDCDCCF